MANIRGLLLEVAIMGLNLKNLEPNKPVIVNYAAVLSDQISKVALRPIGQVELMAIARKVVERQDISVAVTPYVGKN